MIEVAAFNAAPSTSFVLDALEQAVHDRRPCGGLVHHSDRGSQYLSISYTERLAEAGIEPSVGSVGDSYDNAFAETIIREDRADEGDIDREGRGTCALLGALAPILDELLARQLGEGRVTEFSTKPVQNTPFRAAERFADFTEVIDVQVNQAGKAILAADLTGCGVDLLIDRALDLARPFLRI